MALILKTFHDMLASGYFRTHGRAFARPCIRKYAASALAIGFADTPRTLFCSRSTIAMQLSELASYA